MTGFQKAGDFCEDHFDFIIVHGNMLSHRRGIIECKSVYRRPAISGYGDLC